MKTHKRILQRLIDQGRFQLGHRQEQEQLKQPNTLQNIDEASVNFDFEVFIEIGDGRSDSIMMNQASDPEVEAELFCNKHRLETRIIKLLAESLREQTVIQREILTNRCISHQVKKQVAVRGAERILSQSRNRYAWPRQSQEIWKTREQQHGRPKINQVSQEIIEKAGRKSIIDSIVRKSEERLQQHLQNKRQHDLKEIQGYTFHPTINPISQKVDETLKLKNNMNSRHERLYEQHKVYNTRKEQKRRDFVNRIAFKPQINKLSRMICEKKKMGVLESQKDQQLSDRVEANQLEVFRRRNSCERIQRHRKSHGELGKSLYEHAKIRQAKANKQREHFYKDKQNWKIINHSNQMVRNLRQLKIREVFDSLATPPAYQYMNYELIKEDKLSDLQRMFMPIFQEMKEMKTQLNEEEFVNAGLRLLDYLSPVERALLIRKKSHHHEIQTLPAQTMNPKSKQITQQRRYGDKENIYTRGILHKRSVREQIERGRENKVREELLSCTFKPKINLISESIAY